jgi:hypothetical protein
MVTGALSPVGALSAGQEAIADASDAQDARTWGVDRRDL